MSDLVAVSMGIVSDAAEAAASLAPLKSVAVINAPNAPVCLLVPALMFEFRMLRLIWSFDFVVNIRGSAGLICELIV